MQLGIKTQWKFCAYMYYKNVLVLLKRVAVWIFKRVDFNYDKNLKIKKISLNVSLKVRVSAYRLKSSVFLHQTKFVQHSLNWKVKLLLPWIGWVGSLLVENNVSLISINLNREINKHFTIDLVLSRWNYQDQVKCKILVYFIYFYWN